jgi:hypothetical protein
MFVDLMSSQSSFSQIKAMSESAVADKKVQYSTYKIWVILVVV